MSKYLKTLILNLTTRLAELGRNASWLAKEAGTSPSMVSRIIDGGANPTLESLEGLAKALGVSVPELLTPGMKLDTGSSPAYRTLVEGMQALAHENEDLRQELAIARGQLTEEEAQDTAKEFTRAWYRKLFAEAVDDPNADELLFAISGLILTGEPKLVERASALGAEEDALEAAIVGVAALRSGSK